MSDKTTYERLAEPFDQTYTRDVGGRKLTYISGEQVTTRLNEVLGFDGWGFEVRGVTVLENEVWAIGRLTVYLEGRTVLREQTGGQIINRNRQGEIIELANDIKGAVTDTMKKCASLIGVGLWLSERSGGTAARSAPAAKPSPAKRSAHPSDTDQVRAAAMAGGAVPPVDVLVCELCEAELKPVHFKDGTTWEPSDLARYGQEKHEAILCMNHYREANAAKREAAAAPAAAG